MYCPLGVPEAEGVGDEPRETLTVGDTDDDIVEELEGDTVGVGDVVGSGGGVTLMGTEMEGLVSINGGDSASTV